MACLCHRSSVYPSDRLSILPIICMSVRVCHSDRLCVRQSLRTFVHPSDRLYIPRSVFPSDLSILSIICPSYRSSVCPPVCLSFPSLVHPVCLFFRSLVHPFDGVSVLQVVCPSSRSFLCPPICLSSLTILPITRPSFRWSVYPSDRLSVLQIVCPFSRSFLYPPVCLSI